MSCWCRCGSLTPTSGGGSSRRSSGADKRAQSARRCGKLPLAIFRHIFPRPQPRCSTAGQGSLPPPLPPGPRLPPRLRGCARLRHRLRREGSQPLSAGARDVPGFSSFAGGFNPRLFPSRCSLPRYALGAAGSRSPPGAAGGLTPPPALTRPPGPPRWDGADGTVPLRLPPRWGRSLFPRPQPAGTCLAPGWGRCSWRRGGHDVDVPARRASEMQLGRRGWALLVSAWKQSGVFPG